MRIKVLIVDDDVIITMLHKEIVRREMCPDPVSFPEGKKTLDYLLAHHQENKQVLILLDINMPVMNGWELLEAIQTLPFSDTIQVVMVTSSVDSKDRERAQQYAQVIGFVEKPLSGQACRQLKQLPQLSHWWQ